MNKPWGLEQKSAEHWEDLYWTVLDQWAKERRVIEDYKTKINEVQYRSLIDQIYAMKDYIKELTRDPDDSFKTLSDSRYLRYPYEQGN